MLRRCLLSVVALVSVFATLAAAQGLKTIPIRSELRLHPFSNISTPDFDIVDGATVRIDTNFVPGKDKLLFNFESNYNFASDFDEAKGVLYISGYAPISELIDAISMVAFYTESENFQPRRIVWTLGRGTFYNVLTRHFYRFAPAPGLKGNTIGWPSARYNCGQEKLLGMQGYLATVTSYEEQEMLSTKTNMSMWIGLFAPNVTSALDPMRWMWADGPVGEANVTQWTGKSMYEGGVATSTPNGPAFTAWGRFQPEDFVKARTGANYVAVFPSANEPNAFWMNKAESDGIQGWACEYGGLNDTPDLVKKMQGWAGAVVLEYSCSLFETPNECQNRKSYGCQWSGTACVMTTCGQYFTEKACETNSQCKWETDVTATLTGRCAATRCGGLANKESCEADPTCTAVQSYGTTKCYDAKCTDKTTSVACAYVEDCVWQSGLCDSVFSVGCNFTDVVYLLDGSDAMDQPFLTFSGGWQGMIDIFMRATWSGTRTTSLVTPIKGLTGQRVGFLRYSDGVSYPDAYQGSGGWLTGDDIQIQEDLRFYQQGYAPVATRNIKDALLRAKEMFAQPDGVGRDRALVIIAAGPIGDATDADVQALLSDMRVNFKVDVFGIALRPTAPQTLNSTAANASLARLTNILVDIEMDDLLPTVVYGMCDHSTLLGSTFNAPLDNSTLCGDQTDVDSCLKISTCGWSYASSRCERSHCLKYDQLGCGVDPTCLWSSTAMMCKEKCAGNTQGTCNVFSDMCHFNNWTGDCITFPCMANPSEDACIADPYGCQYNASAVVKCAPIPCRFNSVAACDAHYWNGSCQTYNGACFYNPCLRINNLSSGKREACDNNHFCDFTSLSNGCELSPCSAKGNEKECNADFDCAWNIDFSPPACMAATCTGYNKKVKTTAANCALLPDTCKYFKSVNGSMPRCERLECGMMERACDCAKLPQCVWRNDQCKDSRYVQCPAIDVVFMIEASTIMAEPFGRHPNGFVGIVESIRSWSRDAPMTTNATLTGFRFGIILYGAENTAYTIPDEKEGIIGNDVTGNKNMWVGVDGYLDKVEAAQPGYSTSTFGTSRAGILGAMQKANLIWDLHANEDRIKLLVVLGNRAIKGDDSVRAEIVKMEKAGVKIFSNVIRRFSYVTPLDEYARMFVEPIASDPASVYFLFTTIDDMRKTLLDNFCDPSSNTGKMLQISRDRTLPCNWLEGQRECEMQGTCFWNASAQVICPLPEQCNNLGCVTLPDTLKGKFSCHHCQLRSGAFICSRATLSKAPLGLCVPTDCLKQCDDGNCSAAVSATGTKCGWVGASNRCERDFCTAYTTNANCNADLGCVWDDWTAPAACRRSMCWQQRGVTSCEAVREPRNLQPGCLWRKLLSPAVCEERRCPNLNQADCGQYPVMCKWNIGSQFSQKCENKECTYTNGEFCELDKLCFWNPYTNVCDKRRPDCLMSNFGSYTQCTANCGPKAVRWRQRKVIRFPDAVAGASSCAAVIRGLSPATALEVEQCAGGNVSSFVADCVAYCIAKTLSDCVADLSCMWVGSACRPRPQTGCEQYTTPTLCDQQDMCNWDPTYNFCMAAVTTCRFEDPETCALVKECMWRTGKTARQFAAGLGISDTTLFNPGQRPVYVFPLLAFDQVEAANTTIFGATVMIEQGYARGKDLLDLSIPTTSIYIRWDPTRGALFLYGMATVADYGNALHFVTFQTTAQAGTPRLITWSLVEDTVYSGVTGHHYRLVTGWVPVTWQAARSGCAATSMWGLKGYLATITSEEENDVVVSKLGGEGWVSGDDKRNQAWQWTDGPERGKAFWVGDCADCGGSVVPGMFANWDPLLRDPVRALIPGENHVYLNRSGYWHSRPENYVNAYNSVCEFGGGASDTTPPFPTGGATVFGPGGCMATPCLWHANEGNCSNDVDCQWSGFGCQTGCGSRSTVAACSSSERCFWKTDVLPPTCARNPCAFQGKLFCDGNSACKWDKVVGKCMLKTGCAKEETEVGCSALSLCLWSPKETACISRPCESVLDQTSCGLNPMCKWVGGNCISNLCMYPDDATCKSDTMCEWAEPNVVSVGFVPAQDAIHPFENVSATDAPRDSSTIIDGVTVRIRSGFQVGDDKLSLDVTPFTSAIFKQKYVDKTGVLVLYASPSAQLTPDKAFEYVQRFVSFQTSSKRRSPRDIAFVLNADTVYSDGSGSYFKYVKTKLQITSAAAALAVCQANPLFNLRGTLAALTTERDNLALAAIGAQGWFGGSAVNGVWTWTLNNQWYTQVGNNSVLTTDPQTINFWNFQNGYGSPVPNPDLASTNRWRYAAWAADQPTAPKDATTPQRTFMMPGGQWIAAADGSDTGLLPGVICMYGSVNVTAQGVAFSQMVTPRGCFPRRCVSLGETLCRQDSQCVWRPRADGSGFCSIDSWCAPDIPAALTIEQCKTRETCYWDYDNAMCATAPDTPCQKIKNMTQCADPTVVRGCAWNPLVAPKPGIVAGVAGAASKGACAANGCVRHPFQSTCTADPLCRWYQPSAVLGTGVCIERLCGYLDIDACFNDNKCQWSPVSGGCAPSVCLGQNDKCATLPECLLVGNLCTYVRCSAKIDVSSSTGRTKCLSDPSCLINTDSKCYMPNCKQYVTETSCNADAACHFFVTKAAGGLVETRCDAAQCTMNSDEKSCGGGLAQDPCRWDAATGKCRQASASEMAASKTCLEEVEGNLWWMYLLIGLIVLLLGLILWRLWIAYDRGVSFLDPPRKTRKFDVSAYAADLFAEAEQRDDGGDYFENGEEPHNRGDAGSHSPANGDNQSTNNDYQSYEDEL